MNGNKLRPSLKIPSLKLPRETNKQSISFMDMSSNNNKASHNNDTLPKAKVVRLDFNFNMDNDVEMIQPNFAMTADNLMNSKIRSKKEQIDVRNTYFKSFNESLRKKNPLYDSQIFSEDFLHVYSNDGKKTGERNQQKLPSLSKSFKSKESLTLNEIGILSQVEPPNNKQLINDYEHNSLDTSSKESKGSLQVFDESQKVSSKELSITRQKLVDLTNKSIKTVDLGNRNRSELSFHDSENFRKTAQSKNSLSMNQKRRYTYLNYRSSINIVNNSKRQSAIEFQNIQKAVEQSYKLSTFEQYSQKLKVIEYVLGGLSIFNIVLSLLETQLYINRYDMLNLLVQDEEPPGLELALRIITLIISITLGILVYFRYISIIKLRIADKQLSPHDTIFTSDLCYFFLFEMIVSLIFYPPGFKGIYVGEVNQYKFSIVINSIFSLVTLFKIYHAIRVYKYLSKYNNFDAVSICNKFGVKANVIFTLKAEMKSRPFLVLSLVFLMFLLLMSLSLRTFENGIEEFDLPFTRIPGKGTQDLSFILNSMWFIIETVTTVGYGDGFPKTHFGRAVASISCILGIFIISLITAGLSPFTEFNSEERKAYLTIKQLNLDREIKYRAYDVIKIVFLLNEVAYQKERKSLMESQIRKESAFSVKQKGFPNKKAISSKNLNFKAVVDKDKSEKNKKLIQQFVLFTQLKKNITNFKMEHRASGKIIPMDEMLLKMRKTLKSDLFKLESNVNQIKSLILKMDELKEGHERNNDRLKCVVVQQSQLLHYMLQINNHRFLKNFQTKFHPSLKKSRRTLNYRGSIRYNTNTTSKNDDQDQDMISLKSNTLNDKKNRYRINDTIYTKKSLRVDSSLLYVPKEKNHSPINRKSKLSLKSELMKLFPDMNMSENMIDIMQTTRDKDMRKFQTSGLENMKTKQSRLNTHRPQESTNANNKYGLAVTKVFEEVEKSINEIKLAQSQSNLENNLSNLNLNVNLNFNLRNVNKHYYNRDEVESPNSAAE